MKNLLKIQEFIRANNDWEAKLQEKPYCITISRDVVHGRELVMFKYSQIDSDFMNEIVRECRGLILDAQNFEIVSCPFFKFGNVGEAYCPEIDWKSCYVTEKLDGSLIKIVNLGGELLLSTNGTIDAFKAPLAEQIGCVAKSFGELAWYAILENYRRDQGLNNSDCIDPDVVKGWMLKTFKEGYTYMFELTSPFNKVVVTWHQTKLSFIGCRDNLTCRELFFGDHELVKVFDTPKIFPLHSIDECVKAASELDVNSEGYVVVDKDFNRVKVKSPQYVALHHMRNNGVLSFERGLEIVRGNELAEVLTYFPEFTEHLNKIKEDFDVWTQSLRSSEAAFNEWLKSNGYADRHWLVEASGANRKNAAIWIQKNFKIPGLGFALLDAKAASADDWIASIPSAKLVRMLGYKD